MPKQIIALSLFSLVLLIVGCGGATRVSSLANTPLERGSRGPYAASFTWVPQPGTIAATPTDTRGLLAEYAVVDEGVSGTVTLWETAAAERAFHDEAWMKHQPPALSLERFDVPVWIDNGRSSSNRQREVVFTSLPLPTIHPRGIVESRIVERVPEYQAIPELDRKYFTLMEPARFGGIYLWRDEESARRYFDQKWHEQARSKFGADPVVKFFKVVSISP